MELSPTSLVLKHIEMMKADGITAEIQELF